MNFGIISTNRSSFLKYFFQFVLKDLRDGCFHEFQLELFGLLDDLLQLVDNQINLSILEFVA